MIRYFVTFTGQVQGVGFRWVMMGLARDNNVTGWVRNRSNGNVECELQGNPSDVSTLINSMYNGSYYIRVDDYFIKEIPVVEDEKDFIVRL